jgi:hypothetical protein
MNLNKLFPSEEEKIEAKGHFRSLAKNTHWQFFIGKIIKPDIDRMTKTILDIVFKDVNEERNWKRRRLDVIRFSEMPEKIAEALEKKKETVWEDPDPYAKNIKEVEKMKETKKVEKR